MFRKKKILNTMVTVFLLLTGGMICCAADGCGSETLVSPSEKIEMDTRQSSAEWNTAYTSAPLAAGRHCEVKIQFKIKELSPEAYLFAVVDQESGTGPQMASVRWRNADFPEQTFSFFIPEGMNGYRLRVGMYKTGAATLEEIRLCDLPKIDLHAVEWVKSPGYEPYGMCTHFTRWPEWGPEAGFTLPQVQEHIKRLADAGVQWLRMELNWAAYEKYEGADEEEWLKFVDETLRIARQNGLQVYLALGGQPQWASTQPDSPQYWAYGTSRFDAFKKYVRFITERYKGQVRYWEVGNEVDWEYWRDPLEDYVEYLKVASQIIRGVDPENRVILAGLSGNGTHVWDPNVPGAEEHALRRLYEAGIEPWFDVMSVHLYPLSSRTALYQICDGINRIDALMKEFGDGQKPIWLTETGMSTYGNPEALAEQAKLMDVVYTQIIQHPHLDKIFWYNYRCKSGEGDFQNNFGIVENDFSERPAFQTLENLKKHTLKPVNRTMLFGRSH